MSVTELQVVQRVLQQQQHNSSPITPRFLLPLPKEQDQDDDLGLVMRLDGIKKGKQVPAQLCGKSKPLLAKQSTLGTSSFSQTLSKICAQKMWKIGQKFQNQISRMLPLLLYASLLVLAIQAGFVVALLTISPLPLGLSFLLVCTVIIAYFYIRTLTVPTRSTHRSPSPTPPLTPTNSSYQLS